MEEPQKPFACTMPDCGMTFTNEDHLHVHSKKHDMVLQFGSEQRAAFVADQTPTPTRFMRHCEDVGLFQDLQNVNPFDDGFKRAMEAKHNLLSLENAMATSAGEELHTPQMMFPIRDTGDSTLFSTTNNQRNITISRSSSDESGAIKELETTTISKLTNEVTTISRIVEKHDDQSKNEIRDNQKTDSVSYTNNVIKIHSNVEIRKDHHDTKNQTLIYEDTVIKDGNVITKDVLHSDNKLNVPVPPIMSQKSIDFVVDSLTTDLCCPKDDHRKGDNEKSENYEVIIKLPNGRQVRMKSVDEINSNYEKEQVNQVNAKEKLKKAITEKKSNVQSVQIVPNVVPIAGTLIPVTIVNPKVPIVPLKNDKCALETKKSVNKVLVSEKSVNNDVNRRVFNKRDTRKVDLECRSAASRRYRARLKEARKNQEMEIKELWKENEKLKVELAKLKVMITDHMKTCPNADDIRESKEKLKL